MMNLLLRACMMAFAFGLVFGGTTEAQEEKQEERLICEYKEYAPYMILVQQFARMADPRVPNICVGEARCRLPGTSFVSIAVYCRAYGTSCPDATTCGNEDQLQSVYPVNVLEPPDERVEPLRPDQRP